MNILCVGTLDIKFIPNKLPLASYSVVKLMGNNDIQFRGAPLSSL